MLGLLIGLLTLTPLRVASFVMGRLFAGLGPITPWHKRAEDQMKLALPEYPKAERQIWLREMWDNLGRTSAEFIKTRQMLNKGYIQFEGLHHLTDMMVFCDWCSFGQLGSSIYARTLHKCENWFNLPPIEQPLCVQTDETSNLFC